MNGDFDLSAYSGIHTLAGGARETFPLIRWRRFETFSEAMAQYHREARQQNAPLVPWVVRWNLGEVGYRSFLRRTDRTQLGGQTHYRSTTPRKDGVDATLLGHLVTQWQETSTARFRTRSSRCPLRTPKIASRPTCRRQGDYLDNFVDPLDDGGLIDPFPGYARENGNAWRARKHGTETKVTGNTN